LLGPFVAIVACGGERIAPATPPRPVPAVAPAPEPGPKAAVSRTAVDATIRAGLGRFLSHVEVEAALDAKGRFVGWRIRALEADYWAGVDLRPGDVVLRVNGFPIERDVDADRAFRALEVASEIRVQLLRDGSETELRFAIVEE
jgi:S1-C subfamily serine protease